MNPITQILKRLVAKSPKIFQVIKWISILVVLVTGLPGFLESVGITLPPDLLVLENKAIAIAGIVGAVISQLTVDTPEATQKVLESK